jgi:transposase InsO family protein
LQQWFGQLARAELRRLLADFRQEWVAQNPEWLQVLRWTTPGTVWAMDFTEAPVPIDASERYLLALRDLGSGQQLSWLPVADMTAAPVIAELELLFTIHGPPLVLKSDNGSAFIASATQRLLRTWQVWPLFSPPGCPAYNGACEASIRWLKCWTAQLAARRGHADAWTKEDVEAAQHHANTALRAWRTHGPTREDVWQQRRPITPETRAAFAATLLPELATVSEERKAHEAHALSQPEARQCLRQMLERALVAHDLLHVSRRRIPPRILPKKAPRRR